MQDLEVSPQAVLAAHECATVNLVGDLDHVDEARITEHIGSVINMCDCAHVHLDTSGVTFIDAGGLRTLLVSRQAASDRGLGFSFSAPALGPVARLLTVVGLTDQLSDQLTLR